MTRSPGFPVASAVIQREVPSRAKIDLHVHSSHSDGTLPPEEIAALAAEEGLFGLSLTDHDTVAGLDEAGRACRDRNILFIPGVELSISYGTTEIHILGYGIDPRSRTLRETLDMLAAERLERMEKMVSRLRDLGVPAQFEEVRKLARGYILSRLHLAVYLEKSNFVGSREEAFARYIGNGKPAYVRRRRMSLKEAIDLIVIAGGLPVLAHPGITGRDDLIEYLVRIGLRGIEVHYPRHSFGDRSRYQKICAKYDLIATGGSDFHGSGKPEVHLGAALTPPGELEKLLKNIKI